MCSTFHLIEHWRNATGFHGMSQYAIKLNSWSRIENVCRVEKKPALSPVYVELQRKCIFLLQSTAEAQLLGQLCSVWGRRNWRNRQWGGCCCLSPHLCSVNWGVSMHLLKFTFYLAGGVTWQLQANAQRSSLLSLHTDRLLRQSSTTERKYSFFPWHHPARNW